MQARGRRVEFDSKTMVWLWLLGFAGWLAFRLHGPHLLIRVLTGTAINSGMRTVDPDYADAEGTYEGVLYFVRDFAEAERLDECGGWPNGVPRPQADKRGFDTEQQGAFDLIMIATAYLLLHEFCHVKFCVDRNRPARPQEELDCDAFARLFLLEGADDHAERSGQRRHDVLAKRAAGIALGTYVLYEFTPEVGCGGADEYPPAADRLDPLFREVELPADHWFWDFATSLLVAIIVRREPEAIIPKLAGRALCLAIVEMLRARHTLKKEGRRAPRERRSSQASEACDHVDLWVCA
jgi:hypothetical protein